MPNEQQIRQIAQQEISKAQASSRFQLSPTNRHIHNNVDAPFVFLPYTMYGGWVPYDGNINGILETILPKGWTVVHDTTGLYEIHHNLNNSTYSFVAVPTQSTNQVCSPVVESFNNVCYIGWFDTSNAPVDTSFNFILMEFADNNGTFPTYHTNNVPLQ